MKSSGLFIPMHGYFANYHAALTIANVISWNVAVWILDVKKKKKFPNLPYPSWV